MKNTNKAKSDISKQLLGIMDACALTGLSKSCITQQIHAGNIRAVKVARRFLIPGYVILEYMKTPEYEWTKNKSECYKASTSRKETSVNE